MEALTDLQEDPGWSDWRWQMAHAFCAVDDVAAFLGLGRAARDRLRTVSARYPMRVTPYYLSLARALSPADPIIRQILPDPRELQHDPSASPDPLAEERDAPLPGLVHRYPDRALLMVTDACAVHCRHCMRKRLWDAGADSASGAPLQEVLDVIARRPEIREVLVSGGDPLLLPDAVLESTMESLRGIPHVETIRIGSRLPVVLPQRFTPDFCNRLGRHGPAWVATHFNHPDELTAESESAVLNLLRAGIPVVNQTVLLRGVNDDSGTIRRLCTGLLKQRVKPYYLFQGDPVAGTMHFRTRIGRGLRIMEELRGNLSGLAMPAFAVDLPGGGGKVRLEPDVSCGGGADQAPRFRDFRGVVRTYPDSGSGA